MKYKNKVMANVTENQKGILAGIAKESNMSLSNLASIAIYKEMLRDDAFEIDLTLPDLSEYEEYAFAEHANRILNYMKGFRNGKPLIHLALKHDDMKLESLDAFLHGFAEAFNRGHIVSETIVSSQYYKEGTVIYKVKKNELSENKKTRKTLSDLEKYEKLQKKLKKDGLI